jgi:hypothetical protein
LKSDISELKTSEENAMERQKAAKVECKKLEKDMEEFKNNKDGKIDELKVFRYSRILLSCNVYLTVCQRLAYRRNVPPYKNRPLW